jgi:hypothetical protein
MLPIRAALATFAALAATGAAAAADAPGQQAAAFKAVEACRSIKEDAQRLACFDAAVGQLSTAQAKGDVVIVDKEQVRQARREAFGFNLPSLNLFGKTGAPQEEEEISTVTFQVKSADESGGRWTIVMADGSIWRQTEQTVGYMKVKAGSKAEVKKGLLGAYFMNIDNYRAIKIERAK